MSVKEIRSIGFYAAFFVVLVAGSFIYVPPVHAQGDTAQQCESDGYASRDSKDRCYLNSDDCVDETCCEKMRTDHVKGQCFYRLALENGDTGYCKNKQCITDVTELQQYPKLIECRLGTIVYRPGLRKTCVLDAITHYEKPELCNVYYRHLHQSKDEWCLTDYALAQQSLDACSYAENQEEKDGCLLMAGTRIKSSYEESCAQIANLKHRAWCNQSSIDARNGIWWSTLIAVFVYLSVLIGSGIWLHFMVRKEVIPNKRRIYKGIIAALVLAVMHIIYWWSIKIVSQGAPFNLLVAYDDPLRWVKAIFNPVWINIVDARLGWMGFVFTTTQWSAYLLKEVLVTALYVIPAMLLLVIFRRVTWRAVLIILLLPVIAAHLLGVFVVLAGPGLIGV